jgi:hypothetical protein
MIDAGHAIHLYQLSDIRPPVYQKTSCVDFCGQHVTMMCFFIVSCYDESIAGGCSVDPYYL